MVPGIISLPKTSPPDSHERRAPIGACRLFLHPILEQFRDTVGSEWGNIGVRPPCSTPAPLPQEASRSHARSTSRHTGLGQRHAASGQHCSIPRQSRVELAVGLYQYQHRRRDESADDAASSCTIIRDRLMQVS